MVVLSVLRRQLWCCNLFLVDSCYLVQGDSYGGVICSEATVMVVLSVLSRQLWWCYLF